jgi:hypothetical protein
MVFVTVKPTTGDGVIATGQYATALGSGIRVGPAKTFSHCQSLMTNSLISQGCPSYHYGNWSCGYTTYTCSRTAYLGLRFVKNGQTHYGWAHVNVTGSLLNGFSVNLKSLAYETIAGRGITTGLTSG